MSRILRIATRGSSLALWQAQFVADLIHSTDRDLQVELIHVSTTGDRTGGAPLTALGGLGVFTREIQHALLDGRADVAVHSLKDLPTETVDGVALAAVPQRASPWDALVLPRGAGPTNGVSGLPHGARVGTGSPRRRAQIVRLRPDIEPVDVRGNVETRLTRLDDGAFDALILAEAGLERLGLSSRISCRLSPPDVFPAVGQGALGIECRQDDAFARPIVERLNHPPTFAAVTAERQILARLRAGCHAPVGVATAIDGDRLSAEAVVLSRDGKERIQSRAGGPTTEPDALGIQIADELLRRGAARLIEDARSAE